MTTQTDDRMQLHTDLTTWSVHVTGELDVASAPRLAEALALVVARGGRVVLVDLSEATFVDSSGLRVLAAAANDLREVEGRLLVEGASGAVLRTLQAAGQLERLARTA